MISNKDVPNLLDRIYRQDSRRIFASLVRILGDLDLAEEALQDAFAAAIPAWSRDGIPQNPVSWLISTGKFKAIDNIRRTNHFNKLAPYLSDTMEQVTEQDLNWDHRSLQDDQLRLIFACCHPALSHETRVALTLREVCGLKTEEIASAFLLSKTTIAQRIVRGKAKIRATKIPFSIPTESELTDRIDSVLSVIYLVFNEGYSASSGETLTRIELSSEAIRLGRLLLALLPDTEVKGLLALMLLHESRRDARATSNGELIVLDEQDRKLWKRPLIEEGLRLTNSALSSNEIGIYALQAAISATHAQAENAAATNWAQIVHFYDLLWQATESPVVELNRAVAIAMRDGPVHGLNLVNAMLDKGDLVNYHLIHAARADFLRRLRRKDEAAEAYRLAYDLAQQETEKRFLLKRINELG